MKTQVVLSALAGLAAAGMVKREVPQELSKNIYLDIVRQFLNIDNPKNITDPVFGLLGNAAAADGAGLVTNLDCLHQETADQAFTNAKAKGDIRGMGGALVYAASERNTGKVGLASVLCNETAVNPEVAALQQHQDPASPGAPELNKAITLKLAQLLAGIGANPLVALESGTFAPGDVSTILRVNIGRAQALTKSSQVNDPTAKGNTCDVADDKIGCIFTQRLLVLDASVEEISSAVQGITPTISATGELEPTNIDFSGLPVAVVTGDLPEIGNAAAVATATPAETKAAQKCVTIVSTVSKAAAAPVETGKAAGGQKGKNKGAGNGAADNAGQGELNSSPRAPNVNSTDKGADTAGGVNVQEFTGTLGAAAPPVISSAVERPFNVKGSTFLNIGAAITRSCDVQKNECSNAANSGAIEGGVQQCEAQREQCVAANALKIKKVRRGGAASRRATRTTSKQTFRRAADLGSCSNPTIEFGVGFEGRKEGSFRPVNNADFNHGSAQKIGIIAEFICNRLNDQCKAPSETVAQCEQASAAAVAATQDQTAADVFNSVLEGGGAAAAPAAKPAVTAAPAKAADNKGNAEVVTITQCS